MENDLDHVVQTFLHGLDLDKYVPVFEKHGVTMTIFMSLTEDDMLTMGIEQKDAELLLKYCKKFQRCDSKEIPPLSPEDVMKGLKSIDDHLLTVDASLSHTLENLRPEDMIDQAVDETCLSDLIIKTCLHTEKTLKEFDDTLKELLKPVQPEKSKMTSTSTYVVFLAIVIGVAIYFNMAVKK